MKKTLTVLFIVVSFLMMKSNIYAQAFHRVGSIPVLPNEEAGWGNAIVGVDFDGDGKKEIYAVNNNWADGPNELIPKIVKYEFNGTGWDSVWSAKLDTYGVVKQNTWPALTYGDWDNDGRMEVIWSPANFLDSTVNNKNPKRIVVYEAIPGSEAMGVLVSGNTYKPNASTSIITQDMTELRAFKSQLVDIDNDGRKELIIADRSSIYRYAIVSVDKIPNSGDGSEVWTLEASGLGQSIDASVIYDFAVVGNTLALIHQNGKVTQIRATAPNTYELGPVQSNVIPGGSWKTASVVDINNDGNMEVVAGGFLTGNNKIFLVRGNVADTLVTSVIADLAPVIGTGRIYGGDAGDIDLNGKMDFVFGTRDATPNASIIRLEYLGGDITLPASYRVTRIDSSLATGGRWDIIKIGNVDNDAMNEVVYGNGIGGLNPLTILDVTGQLPVELKSFTASAVKGGVNLVWSTATEVNNAGFEIQRRSGTGSYVTVGFVVGKGTTTNISNYSFMDKDVPAGKYSYRLKQADLNGNYTISDAIEVNSNIPSAFSLEQNYPNPFNPSTIISFAIPEKSNVTMKIYSAAGQEVATVINNEQREAGTYNVNFDGKKLASGMYIYTITANGKMLSKKMTLIK
jgi:hypothetical protein